MGHTPGHTFFKIINGKMFMQVKMYNKIIQRLFVNLQYDYSGSACNMCFKTSGC